MQHPASEQRSKRSPWHVRWLRAIEDDGVRRPMRWAVRGVLALTLAIAVLWEGGTSIHGLMLEVGLLTLALVLATAARARTTLRVRMGTLWLGLGGWTVLQLLPLPHAIVGLLSPRAVALADASRAALGFGPASFLPIAISPGDAALQGALYLIGGAWAVLASIALAGSTGTRAVRALRHLVIGLALLSSWSWLGGYHPASIEFLPDGLQPLLQEICFVNPNHQSALANLAMALAIGETLRAPTIRAQTVQGLLATSLAIAVLLIASRGGVLVLCLTLALNVVALPGPPKYLRVDKAKRQDHSAIRLAGIVSVALLSAAVLALPALEREFLDHDVSQDVKIATFMRIPHMLSSSWLVGTAPGGLGVVAGLGPSPFYFRVDFAENIILDRLFSGGLLAAVAWLIGLAWVARDLWRRRTGVEGATALHIGLGMVLVANMVDFSLEVSGVLLPFLAASACLERLSSEHGRSTVASDHRRSHFLWIGITALTLLCAAGLLVRANRGATRQAETALEGHTVPELRERILRDFPYHHHAFYVLGRRLLTQGDAKGAVVALDRAIALRPDSKYARMLRFTARVRALDRKGAGVDLMWLLTYPERPTRATALQLASTLPGADDVLIDIAPALAKDSYDLGLLLRDDHRPDLVERFTLALRAKYPRQHFGIEAVLGDLYVRLGKIKPASRLAAILLADPATRSTGYILEATVLIYTGHIYEAHHLLNDVCEKEPGNQEACGGAIGTILAASRPMDAYLYVRSRMPFWRDTPQRAAVYNFWLAQTQIQLERYDDAIESLRLSVNLNGETPDNQRMLAQCLIKVGQYREARDILDKCIKDTPKDKRLHALSEELDRETRPAMVRQQIPVPVPVPASASAVSL